MQSINNSDYQNSMYVPATIADVYVAITQRIPEWWSQNFEGAALKKGDEFTVRFGATFKTMRITESTPNQRVEWTCIDQHIEAPPGLTPIKNTTEWVGTRIVWTLDQRSDGTTIRHRHIGLTPDVECWSICETGWDQTLKSLHALLVTGEGRPFQQLDEEHLTRARAQQTKGSVI